MATDTDIGPCDCCGGASVPCCPSDAVPTTLTVTLNVTVVGTATVTVTFDGLFSWVGTGVFPGCSTASTFTVYCTGAVWYIHIAGSPTSTACAYTGPDFSFTSVSCNPFLLSGVPSSFGFVGCCFGAGVTITVSP
jgi:hypothetical protein